MVRRAGRFASACVATTVLAACTPSDGVVRHAGRTSSTPRASASVSGPARIVYRTTLDPRLVSVVIASPAVGADVPVRILLPHDYVSRPHARWPVLYLLHGCCDDQTSWIAHTDIEALASRTNVMVVMPDGGRDGFYSNWRRGPQWETFHLQELPSILTADFRAGGARAVAGLSMGGLGALDYAARHRGTFVAAASFSGTVDTRLDSSTSGVYQQIVRSEGHDPDDLWGDPVVDADRWRAHDPYDLAGRLRGVRLFVSSGDGEPGPLDAGRVDSDPTEDVIGVENARLVARLRALHIPVAADLYGPGTHSFPYWNRELHRAWPMLLAALRPPPVGAA